MKSSTATDALCLLALLASSFAIGVYMASTRSGTGSVAVDGSSSPPLRPLGERLPLKQQQTRDPSDPGSRVGARFPTPHESSPQTAPDALGDDFAGIDSQSLLDLEPGVQPTADGLFERTVGQWSQEGFLALTVQEAASMLPLDPELPGHGGSLLDLVGGLPTREDSDRAFEQRSVKELLWTACADEVQLYQLQEAHDPKLNVSLEIARYRFESAEDALMQELDRVSGYRNWMLLNRAFREWIK